MMGRVMKRTVIWAALTLLSASCHSLEPLPSSAFEQPNPLTLRNKHNLSIYSKIPIMSQGQASARQLKRFLMTRHKGLSSREALEMANTYIKEAAVEGVNHDIAFCQMCVETNYLRFGGAVKPWQNNFCGLGATGGSVKGAAFKDKEIGVRAHIQHLKAYASVKPLKQKRVDPRFHLVRRGKSPRVNGLTKTWAMDPNYGDKIMALMMKLNAM